MKNCDNILTDSFGRPASNDSDSLTASPNGPVLLEDTFLLDKISHFDRERIPERVVHAKGAGAFGVFKTYKSMCKYTKADFLQNANQETKVFVRFSTVIGSKGSADTVRDPRGFATKFYTNEGIYDIVGNNLPVFFISDSIKFPDVIHSLKPAPNTNLRDACRFWDFISLTPESTHMITWLYSDRGTIKNYAKMDGFGVNTYIWVNKDKERFFIKYHWKTKQGIETIDRREATLLAGTDPDIATMNLYNDILCGKCPEYELCVQILNPKDADKLPFNPLDDTKTWPENIFPLIPIGIMTLNRNPQNFFAETEQAAFCPSNLVSGVGLSADKMLQGRSFSYVDTQRHRIGPNFMQLPINSSISPVNNNQRDGQMTYTFNPEPINYSPNSLNNNNPKPAGSYYNSYPINYNEDLCVGRFKNIKPDDYTQAGMHYRSLSEIEQRHLSDNIAVELCQCNQDIINRVLDNFSKADKSFGYRVYHDIIKYKHSYPKH